SKLIRGHLRSTRFPYTTLFRSTNDLRSVPSAFVIQSLAEIAGTGRIIVEHDDRVALASDLTVDEIGIGQSLQDAANLCRVDTEFSGDLGGGLRLGHRAEHPHLMRGQAGTVQVLSAERATAVVGILRLRGKLA